MSGLLTRQKGNALAKKWRETPQAAVSLRELLKFRERLRAAVLRQEAGFSASDAFIAELNSLLKQHPSVIALQRKGEKLGLETAIAVAELFSDVSTVRLRKCEYEACIAHFLDTSKKGSRRWCSMNICGNKIKVAAYQKRRRAAGKKMPRGR